MTDEQIKILVTACRFGGTLWMSKGDGRSSNRQLLDGLVSAGLLAPPVYDSAQGNLKWTVTAEGKTAAAARMKRPNAAA
jgi:hypothetical protein